MGTPNYTSDHTLKGMPIRVWVRYFANPRLIIGVREEAYNIEEGTRLITLLTRLIPQRHGERGELWLRRVFAIDSGDLKLDDPAPRRGLLILLNGRSYNEYPEGLNHILRDGDVISILEMVGGG